jgi:hypothetical protein
MSDDMLLDNDGADEEIELTDEQWKKVQDLWNSRPNNPPSLKELTCVAFGRNDLDGRTAHGKALKKKLAESRIKPPVANEKKPELILTEEQKEYLENNCATMKAVEMTRILFKNDNLTNLNLETRAVLAYLKTLAKPVYEDPDAISDKDYRPPKSFDKTLAKINKYRLEQIERDKLTGKQKKDIAALLGYINTYRFVHQINTYEAERDRELFESTFVRCCHDKNDLTEEEVDQYILYSQEVVIQSSISERVEKLRRLLDEASESDDKKIAMGLVEAIDKTQQEYDKCVNRQNKLLDALKMKRSEKEGKTKVGTANIINLIHTFKEEESRKRLLKYAQFRKEKLKEGVSELMNMDELHARILGLSEDEALNG